MKLPFKSLFTRIELLLIVYIVGLFVAIAGVPAPTHAATPNVSVGGGQVLVVPFHLSGAYTATAASAVKFPMPMPCRLIGVTSNARAISGTTNTVDVKLDGVSVLSAVMTIAAAGTVVEGTISTAAIGDEGVVTVDINIVATSLTDVTVVLTCVRT